MGRRRIWVLGVLIKRWKHLLWISPFAGVLFGLVMVWLFFHANVTSAHDHHSQQLSQHEPEGHEESSLSRLGSKEVTREVQQDLIQDHGGPWLPRWWIQRSVKIEPYKRKWLDYDVVYLRILSRHPSDRVARNMGVAYQKIADRYNKERYQKMMGEWIAERRALIKSIQAAGGDAAALQAQLAGVEGDQDHLEQWIFLMNGGSYISFPQVISCGGSLRGASKGLPPWWEDMPLWWRYMIKCAVWGLLAGPVFMYLFEAFFPRKSSIGFPEHSA